MKKMFLVMLASSALTFLVGCSDSDDLNVEWIIAGALGDNVVVVVIDAAARDHLGCYGYHRDTTPRLDEIAAESVIFDNAFAQASGTMLSVFSYFTSRYPVFGDRPINNRMVIRIPAKLTTMAEFMADRYEHRLGATSNTWLKSNFGHDEGFTRYLESWRLPPRDDGTDARDPELAAASLDWMLDRGDDPFFAYVHLLRPHGPYDPPEPYRSRFLDGPVDEKLMDPVFLQTLNSTSLDSVAVKQVTALYDGGLAHVDALIGDMVDGLREAGVWDRTVFVLMSDHGQCHWEDGRTWGHGGTVREEALRVPLFVRIPGVVELEGRRVDAPVELVDLLPTLLELTDIPVGGIELAGRSWLPLMAAGADRRAGDDSATRRVIHSRTNRRDPAIHVLRDGHMKLVWEEGSESPRLFDLAADPGERNDLVAAGADDGAGEVYLAALRHWLVSGGADGAAAGSQPYDTIDEAARKRLEALGY